MMSEATEPPRCVWSSARPSVTIATTLPGDRAGELRLDHGDGQRDRVVHLPLVDERRQVHGRWYSSYGKWRIVTAGTPASANQCESTPPVAGPVSSS